MLISDVWAKKILNSKKEETIKVVVKSGNRLGVGCAPSGTSTGKREVIAFPNNDVDKAVDFINNLDLSFLDINKFEDFLELENFLKEFDNTKDMSIIGGNSVIALEFAILNLFQPVYNFLSNRVSIPLPIGNCVGGGAHVLGESADFQEFLVIAETDNFFDANFANMKCYRILREKIGVDNRSIEGALAPNLSNLEILDIMHGVVKEVSKNTGIKVRLGVDMASSNFYDGFNYNYSNFSLLNKKNKLSRDKQIDFVLKLIKKYKLYYVEDPLYEDDFSGFEILRKKSDSLICGDDLIVTSPDILSKNLNSVNSVIIKPNQVGSLIKTKKIIDIAKKNKIVPIISHRSGETSDTTIVDLAVGWNVPFIKCGVIGEGRENKLRKLGLIEKNLLDGITTQKSFLAKISPKNLKDEFFNRKIFKL